MKSRAAFMLRMLGRGLLRPRLLFLMATVGWRFRRRDWYRRWPFLPLPPARYMDWRLHTAFGDADGEPTPKQLELFLRWARSLHHRS